LINLEIIIESKTTSTPIGAFDLND